MIRRCSPGHTLLRRVVFALLLGAAFWLLSAAGAAPGSSVADAQLVGCEDDSLATAAFQLCSDCDELATDAFQTGSCCDGPVGETGFQTLGECDGDQQAVQTCASTSLDERESVGCFVKLDCVNNQISFTPTPSVNGNYRLQLVTQISNGTVVEEAFGSFPGAQPLTITIPEHSGFYFARLDEQTEGYKNIEIISAECARASLDFECDGSFFPYARGGFAVASEASVLITTTIQPIDQLGEPVGDPVQTTPPLASAQPATRVVQPDGVNHFGYWEWSPGRGNDFGNKRNLNRQGRFEVTIDVTGTDAENQTFTTQHKQIIRNDCVYLDIDCATATLHVLNDGDTPEFPPRFGDIYANIGPADGLNDRIEETDATGWPIPGAGLYSFAVYEEESYDYDYEEGGGFLGDDAFDGPTSSPAGFDPGLLENDVYQFSLRVIGGSFVCLSYSTACANGVPTLAVDPLEYGASETSDFKNRVPAYTANGVAPDDADAWPLFTWTLPGATPGSDITVDQTGARLYHFGTYGEIPTALRCVVEPISLACAAGRVVQVPEQIDLTGTPDRTDISYSLVRSPGGSAATSFDFPSSVPSGAQLTVLVGTPEFDDDGYETGGLLSNGVFWRGAGSSTLGPLTAPDCTAGVYFACVAGVPTLTISALDPAPDGFTGFAVSSGTPVASGGGLVFELPQNTATTVSTEPADIGVHLFNNREESAGRYPLDLNALDCQVTVSARCVSGQAQLRVDPGNTGLTSATVRLAPGADATTLTWSDDPQDTTPIERTFSRDVAIELTSSNYRNSVEDLAIVVPPGDSTILLYDFNEEGVDLTSGTIPLTCEVHVTIECGVGDGGPTGRAEFRVGERTDLPAGTTISIADPAAAIADGFNELPDGSLLDGDTFDVSASNGVYVTPDVEVTAAALISLDAPYCSVNVNITLECRNGVAFAVITAGPGDDFELSVTGGTETTANSYRFDGEEVTVEVEPFEDDVLVDPASEITVTPPGCEINAFVVCGAGEGGPTGTAQFRTNLSSRNVPSGTSINTGLSGVDPVMNGDTIIDQGITFTATVSNGVVFAETGTNASSLTVPYCLVTLDVTVNCAGGQPMAVINAGQGQYSLRVEDGTAEAPPTGGFTPPISNAAFAFDDATTPMQIALIETAPANVLVVNNAQTAAALNCVAIVGVVCQSGVAVATAALNNGPTGAAVTPANGDQVAQGAAVSFSATAGVFVSDGTTQAETVALTAPMCEARAQLVCQVGDGGPTGRAVLQTNLSGTPSGTTIQPGAGATVASGSSLIVTLDPANGVVFASSGSTSDTLTAPLCLVTGTALARCASGGGIEVEVITSGASAQFVVIDGVAQPATGTRTVVGGLPLRESYNIGIVPADVTNVAAGAVDSAELGTDSRCRIEVSVSAECVSGTEVLVRVLPVEESTTGTIGNGNTSVDGDSTTPFMIEPGSPGVIAINSPDTFPEDITIPEYEVPATCGGISSLGGTLNVVHKAVCVANGSAVEVELSFDGSTTTYASISVNSDGAPPYLVTPGAPIIITVIPLRSTDLVEISDTPEVAPMCIVPVPEPIPEPVPPVVVLPPPVLVTFIPDPEPPPAEPEPSPAPEPPTTEPEPEPEPEPPAPPPPPPPAPPAPPPPPPPPPPVVDPVPDEVLGTALPLYRKSKVLLPATCDVEDIDLPGVVKLVREGVTEDGRIEFVAETATLKVGTYQQTISCQGDQVAIELVVYRQIGGQNGAANTVNGLTILGLAMTAVLVGAPAALSARTKEILSE